MKFWSQCFPWVVCVLVSFIAIDRWAACRDARRVMEREREDRVKVNLKSQEWMQLQGEAMRKEAARLKKERQQAKKEDTDAELRKAPPR